MLKMLYGFIVSLVLIVNTGCSALATLPTSKQTVLHLLDVTPIEQVTNGYMKKMESTRSKYVDLFQAKYPTITLEVELFEGTAQELTERLQSNQSPDVVLFETNQLPVLLSDNLLQPLDPLISKSNFDLQAISPTLVESFKQIGNGTIYSLAPFFSSKVVVYNKAFFNAAGVAFPTNQMTWDQLFELAGKMTSGDGKQHIAGISLSNSDLLDSMSVYTSGLASTMISPTGDQLNVDQPEWEKTWTQFSRLYHQKIIPTSEDFMQYSVAGPFTYDDFLSKRSAMSVVDIEQIQNIMYANQKAAKFENFSPIDFDVVSLPVHRSGSNEGGNATFYGLMGIPVHAANAEDAWTYLQYINSDEFAKIKQNTTPYLSTHESIGSENPHMNFNLKAFYSLIPTFDPQNPYLYFNDDFRYQELMNIGRSALKDVLDGKITAKDGLLMWKQQGEVILKDIQSHPDAKKNPFMSY